LSLSFAALILFLLRLALLFAFVLAAFAFASCSRMAAGVSGALLSASSAWSLAGAVSGPVCRCWELSLSFAALVLSSLSLAS
jgi:hypothetical protein